MAPSLTEAAARVVPVVAKPPQREPLKSTGVLESFDSFDVTPIICREELALTVSQPSVVFFRKQDDLDNDLQKELVQRLGKLSGKPATTGLHIHPTINAGREHGNKDDESSVISLRARQKLFKGDYTILRLTELPRTGGATYAQPGSNEIAKNTRRAPENVGDVLQATHPVIRTNPVTVWKSIFAVGHHVQKIDGLTEEETRHLLDWFVQLIVENHDLQVRLRWQNPNDLVYHAATPDYGDSGPRTGQCVVGLGEKPFLDPNITGRREALTRRSRACDVRLTAFQTE
ncbi:TauD/TfdA dioxygenase family protein [Aspergillus homomorphus CBS 101889]|uniref:TauD-domain-containing protein n=1 Tax=Aspergillus homomorphus (strain CBS 101889) TaxID=1450537 RepID=A0A395HSD2_ASPHC|nr:TauD-domain-containing protein [Aspergillus homomorphus CBS 101889]RAL10245.1 TauD-domain-containing protein [Aspergillus homomorphus CBS 101889]